MGYYSEVAYVMSFVDSEARKKFITYIAILGGDTYEALKECTVGMDDDMIMFHAGCTKWYESFTDIAAHHDLMAVLNAEPFNELGGYYFVRMGEDMSDIEHRSGGDDGCSSHAMDFIEIRRELLVSTATDIRTGVEDYVKNIAM